ncbi:MAG: hypothetical protein JSS59_15185 [Proteobacteria bacterium]|uniref:hypothetical protein n=1 Tax=Rudaea sp. TaxID=2136325 RepID=UPI0037832441|nr:hypothetical protein [Pseudomonadota bacterium]
MRLFVVFVLAFALNACSSMGTAHLRKLDRQEGDVRLAARIPSGKHQIHENLPVTISLKNIGKKPVLIPNAWIATTSLYAEDSSGKGLVANPIREMRLPPSLPGRECDDMRNLEPGQTVEKVNPIAVSELGIETSGIYNILIGYRPNGYNRELTCDGASFYVGYPEVSIEVDISER